jgi:hypothetical protein
MKNEQTVAATIVVIPALTYCPTGELTKMCIPVFLFGSGFGFSSLVNIISFDTN